ncbi:GLPGLI family protein [Empedobacter falsenii]
MKNTILFFLFSYYINAQYRDVNYVIDYDFIYVKDSLNKDFKDSERMYLFTNNKEQLFINKNSYLADSIGNDVTSLVHNKKLNIKDVYAKFGRTDNNIKLFYNNSNKNYLNQTNIALLKINLEDYLPEIYWDLHNDEKVIKGYKVKKATTNLFGRNWEAWYTEDIPVSYGPYKFNGLPGLILDIKDSEDFFHFEFISFAKSKSSIPKAFDSGRVKMTRIEFMDYIKKYKENPLIVLGESNSVVRDDETFFKRKKALLELNNNSIERGIQFNLK